MIVAHLFCGAGLPKPAAARLDVGPDGVRGDVNRYRRRRGGDPDMALSLLAVEIVTAVAAEGWPLAPGSLGENVATLGVDHARLAAGQRWRIGGALVELSRRMEPCKTLAALVGPERLAALQRTLRGRRGWYARVLEPGPVHVGDVIALTPRA